VTFSIVAVDRDSGALGGAVASRFFAVGALIPAIEPGVGAVASQALANGAYPSLAFPRLRDGAAPDEVVAALTAADEGRSDRQLGIVDGSGAAAAYTGAACMEAATHRTGPGYAIQGNLLASESVIERMEEAFLGSGSLPLAERLLAALLAGDDAGGDRRGRQGAALAVRRAGGGLFGTPDLVCDLRVDDHPAAPRELARLYAIHTHYFVPAPDAELIPITPELATELRHLVAARGADPGRGPGYDTSLRTALEEVVGVANLEERWRDDERIDPVVLGVLRGDVVSPDG
jgi:uncharacterized Ntn-hydrolase superfamily protein